MGYRSLVLAASLVLGVTFTGAVPPVLAASDSLPDLPVVSTLAGSGAIGNADGLATETTFVTPAAVAFDRTGTLFVADRDGQRIRAVDAAGRTRTLAGSGEETALGIAVPGGFRDGPAATARFNSPEGVVSLADGTVVVADTKNFCLRMISNGVVTTFAGDHEHFGGVDGPRAAARFRNPSALAVDRAGTIFVADYGNGVRRIDRNGEVTTLHFSDSEAVEAIAVAPNAKLLAAATSGGIRLIDLDSLTIRGTVPIPFDFGRLPAREGGREIGSVTSMAAFDDRTFVTVDTLNSTVRFIVVDDSKRTTYVRTLSRTPDENAAFGSAAFADGAGQTARFDEPLGIAIASDGRIAVADAGNRRVRMLGLFDHRSHVDVDRSGSDLPDAIRNGPLRVGIVGDSYIWFDQAWHESIPGMVEDELNASRKPGARAVRVYPIMRFGISNDAALDLISTELEDGALDAIVDDMTTYGQIVDEGEARALFPAGFGTALAARLEKVSSELHVRHIPFVAVMHPGAADFPDEFAYRRLPKGSPSQGGGDTVPLRDALQVQQMHDDLAAAVAAANTTALDLWPAFVNAYAASDRTPLFETWDHHFTPAGRAIVARGIARTLAPMLDPH